MTKAEERLKDIKFSLTKDPAGYDFRVTNALSDLEFLLEYCEKQRDVIECAWGHSECGLPEALKALREFKEGEA